MKLSVSLSNASSDWQNLVFGSFEVVLRYLELDVKVKRVVRKVAIRRANGEEGDGKVNELSYGNLEGTDQGNVKLLSKDNFQRIAASIIERGHCIE